MIDFDLMFHLEDVRKIWPQVNDKTAVAPVEPDRVRVECRVDDQNLWYESTALEDKTGFKFWLWRVAGTLFNKHEWLKRGSHLRYEKNEMHAERIEIKQYTGQSRYSGMIKMKAGYSKMTDTLFIASWEQRQEYHYDPPCIPIENFTVNGPRQ